MASKKTEYGKPTYARAVMARVGIGDGWGNPRKNQTKSSTPYQLPQTAVKTAVNNRKKMLDEL